MTSTPAVNAPNVNRMPSPKTGVLIANLGTPDAPTKAAVKRYLGEFLSDRRVVEIPSLLWQPILRGIILNTRPKKSAHAYQMVWTDRGSPLAFHTQDTAQALSHEFAQQGIIVDWAMRYGNPSIASRLEAMKKAGCERILFAPLYPQYSGATTATANDALFAALAKMRWQPAVRTLPPYYDDPAYIDALANSARQHLRALPAAPEALLLSFHGMPLRTKELGDPYYDHCMGTARLLSQALAPDYAGTIRISFQSRFGPAKWIGPSTEDVLEELAKKGVRHVAVMTPGFSADCLETLEEIALRGKEFFCEKGGEKLDYFPCLNAESAAIILYTGLIRRELAGWV